MSNDTKPDPDGERDGAARGLRSITIPAGEQRRQIVLTIAVVLAIGGVWAVALGILDAQSPVIDQNRYGASMRTRVERRPALFVVTTPQDESPSPSVSTVTAVAIALVEPGGVLRSPISRSGSDEDQGREMRAFADTYFASNETLELLRGGALAGTLKFAGDTRSRESLPVARLTAVAPGQAPGIEREEALLAVTDRRFGAASSGVRPMREAHRFEIDQLTRKIVRDRFPGYVIDGEPVSRVRVADLNRDGQPEVLASVTLTLRADARPAQNVSLFMIGEAASSTDAGATLRAAYVNASTAAESTEPASVTFVDQVDLSPDTFDEVVLRSVSGDSMEYVVVQRRDQGWVEIFASDPLRREVRRDGDQ